eukprot:574248-Ditylum_brightwellii.AAC.1
MSCARTLQTSLSPSGNRQTTAHTVAKDKGQKEEEDVVHPKHHQVSQKKEQYPSVCITAGPTASPQDHSTQVPTAQHQKKGIRGKPFCLIELVAA